MSAPISKSQIRALRLLNLALVDSYEAAAEALGNAGCRKDAIPSGSTWRAAAKLSDADLLAAIALPADRYEDRVIEY